MSTLSELLPLLEQGYTLQSSCGESLCGKWRECSTIFEVKCGILVRNIGIDPSEPGKTAPDLGYRHEMV